MAVPFLLKQDHLSLRTEIYKLYHHKVELISIMGPHAQEWEFLQKVFVDEVKFSFNIWRYFFLPGRWQ